MLLGLWGNDGKYQGAVLMWAILGLRGGNEAVSLIGLIMQHLLPARRLGRVAALNQNTIG